MNDLAIDFLSKDFPKPQQPVFPLTAKELKKFSGYYAPRAPRNQLFAFMEQLTGGTWTRVADGKLECSALFGKGHETLLPVGKNLFRGEKEPEATAAVIAGIAEHAGRPDWRRPPTAEWPAGA